MLKYGNREFRNLQEQVAKNMNDIQFILEEEGVLNEYGVKVVGQKSSVEYLPTVAQYKADVEDWSYGDSYAVGTNAPYQLYILVRANGGHSEDYWFNIGEFPKPGTDGKSAYQVAVDNGFEGTEAEWLESIKGEKGDTGATGATGPQGERGLTGYLNILRDSAEACVALGEGYMDSNGNLQLLTSLDPREFTNCGQLRGPRGYQGPRGETGYMAILRPDADSCVSVGEGYVDDNGYLRLLTDLDPRTFVQSGYLRGPQGPQGIRGATGYSSILRPNAASCVNAGEAYIDSDGHLQVMTVADPATFVDCGSMKGPQGSTGPQGPKGDRGDPGYVSIVRENADACVALNEAYVDSSGYLQLLASLDPRTFVNIGNIKGPRGYTGPQGIQGVAGVAGPQGVPGLVQGITVNGEEQEIDENAVVNITGVVMTADLAAKQDKLTAGDNITITEDNVISATAPSVYTAGDGIVISDSNEISVSTGIKDGADLGLTAAQPSDLASYNVAVPEGTTAITLTTLKDGDNYYRIPEGGISEAVWGEIGGTLSAQSDLQTALDAKANSSSLATVATSGSYNDLSDTPTIPAAVSGTNDGTNWTNITIGSDTYAIPQGGGSGSGATIIKIVGNVDLSTLTPETPVTGELELTDISIYEGTDTSESLTIDRFVSYIVNAEAGSMSLDISFELIDSTTGQVLYLPVNNASAIMMDTGEAKIPAIIILFTDTVMASEVATTNIKVGLNLSIIPESMTYDGYCDYTFSTSESEPEPESDSDTYIATFSVEGITPESQDSYTAHYKIPKSNITWTDGNNNEAVWSEVFDKGGTVTIKVYGTYENETEGTQIGFGFIGQPIKQVEGSGGSLSFFRPVLYGYGYEKDVENLQYAYFSSIGDFYYNRYVGE